MAITLPSLRGLFERSRTVAAGEWVTPTFANTNFYGGGSMTWTVGATNVVSFGYTLLGKTMTVAFELVNTVIGGTVSDALVITVPAGYSVARNCRNAVSVQQSDNYTTGMLRACAETNYIVLYKDVAGSNFIAGNANMYGEITFEVQ